MGEHSELIYLKCANYDQILYEGIKNLYDKREWADLSLKVNPEDAVLVHTIIIAIFAPQLIVHCKENRCDLSNLNIDSQTLSTLLHFIYKGEIEVARNQLTALARGAQLMGFAVLKEVIDNEIKSDVNYNVEKPAAVETKSLLKLGNGAIFKCSHCEFHALRGEDFKEHLKNIHQVNLENGGRLKTSFKCRDCDFIDENKQAVIEHRKTQHLKIANLEGAKKFKCCHCDFVAEKKSVVSDHIKNAHSNDLVFKCEECDFMTKSEKRLKSHNHSHHCTGDFICGECDRRFFSRAGLLKHNWIIHVSPEVRNSCHLCDFKTTLTSDLRKHMQEDHKIFKKRLRRSNVYCEKVQCTHCGQVLRNRTYLIDHLAYKHRLDADGNPIQPKYNCRSCDFITYSHVELYRHNYKLHSKVEFRCDQCNFKARCRKVVSDHIQAKHFGIRKYMCEVCGRCFSSEYVLNGHRKAHASSQTENVQVKFRSRKVTDGKARDFPCELCDKSFLQKAHLKQHIHHVHNENARKHQCHKCTYAAKTRCNLMKHIKTVHKEINEEFCLELNKPMEETDNIEILEVPNFELVMQVEELS